MDFAGSSRWQRSKGRLPEEDKEFMKALVKNVNLKKRTGTSRLLMDVDSVS